MTADVNRILVRPDGPDSQAIQLTENGAIGHFRGHTLHSVFQPIYSFAHDAPVGYEALLRATSAEGKAIAPSELFSGIKDRDDLMQLEQISGTLHFLNFLREDPGDAWLFLNISTRLIRKGYACLRQLLEVLNSCNILPSRVVIEFIEDAVTDVEALKRAAGYLRQSGCLIAIDDFGAGDSNFNRIWDLQPDIVKLDKSILDRAREKPMFRRSCASLVELLHENGALVLMECIEDKPSATLACEVNVDFHQGYFFGKPQRKLQGRHRTANPYFNRHSDICYHISNGNRRTDLIDQLSVLFSHSAAATHPGASLARTCEALLNHPHVVRCYLLDDKGYQIGDTVHGQHAMQNIDSRFRILGNSQVANWSRRSYFRRAMSKPQAIQTTRPYFSLTGAHLCITLSVTIEVEKQTFVLCCDIKWTD